MQLYVKGKSKNPYDVVNKSFCIAVFFWSKQQISICMIKLQNSVATALNIFTENKIIKNEKNCT